MIGFAVTAYVLGGDDMTKKNCNFLMKNSFFCNDMILLCFLIFCRTICFNIYSILSKSIRCEEYNDFVLILASIIINIFVSILLLNIITIIIIIVTDTNIYIVIIIIIILIMEEKFIHFSRSGLRSHKFIYFILGHFF